MIYVKAPLNENASIDIGIRQDNTYTRCPKCGKEIPINLADFTDEEDFDPTNFDMMCETCSAEFVRKLVAERRRKA